LKSSIGTDVVTLRVEGGEEERARAEQAVRRFEGIAEVRRIDDAVIAYVPEGTAAVAQLILLLADASVRAREVTLAQPTLDDVFLRATGHHLDAAESQAQRSVTRERG
jgi:ABC-2 type transport system ATP-binding protein